MKIERVEQYYIQMPLKHFFETSFGREEVVEKVVVAVYAEGLTGYGESPVERRPFYSSETVETCWHIQRDFLIPMLFEKSIAKVTEIPANLARVRGHNMAKAGLEAALWDIEAQMANVSVAELLGGTANSIACGVSIGIQNSVDELLDTIAQHLAEGYQRIKIKIKPGWDSDVTAKVRERYPDILLMVDANSAYTLQDTSLLQQLDAFNLLMIEQPLDHDDILDHATLQKQLKTPLCLDESIHTLGHAREALALNSCRIINIKPARVSGITTARSIHDLCQQHKIPVWCGGLLESGIGRAHNIAVAALPGFTLPSDISASDRYWHEDIIDPPFTLNANGTIDVPQGTGIGVTVIQSRLDKVTARKETYRA
jgi:O-succinylbenzoate synthase